MPQTLPPYALSTPTFRFRHLAAFAGKAPIGGAREVALAALVVARLAADCREDMGEEPGSRATRCAAAKTWLGTLALPASVRTALTRCADASAIAHPPGVAQELSALSKAVKEYLDPLACGELDALVVALRS